MKKLAILVAAAFVIACFADLFHGPVGLRASRTILIGKEFDQNRFGHILSRAAQTEKHKDRYKKGGKPDHARDIIHSPPFWDSRLR